jgi:hypothetical protein
MCCVQVSDRVSVHWSLQPTAGAREICLPQRCYPTQARPHQSLLHTHPDSGQTTPIPTYPHPDSGQKTPIPTQTQDRQHPSLLHSHPDSGQTKPIPTQTQDRQNPSQDRQHPSLLHSHPDSGDKTHPCFTPTQTQDRQHPPLLHATQTQDKPHLSTPTLRTDNTHPCFTPTQTQQGCIKGGGRVSFSAPYKFLRFILKI